MLEYEEIEQIAKQVAADTLGARHILRVMIAPTTDVRGNEALAITMVVKPSVRKPIMEGKSLDTLIQILDKLEAQGEVRYPIISYATEKELATDVDSEP